MKSRRNVPVRYGTNLCKQTPQLPSKCTHPHGMLMDLQGQSVSSLYSGQVLRHRDDVVSKAGAGLFVRGGNPIYYTSKGNAEDLARQVHAVLRGDAGDLAGHHLVLKVSQDSWTGSKYMRVDRAPLVAIDMLADDGAADPAVHLYSESLRSTNTTWGNLDGWLYNLAGVMRLEQSLHRVDELYPISPANLQHSTRWSCPLRRLSFWSKVTREFSPLVPSPMRAARLFGDEERNMLHGMRSHPTQLFGSLYDKLANVVTSNGFCYCVSWWDCQVASTDAVNKDCGLLETIRSMYDGKFRTARQLANKQDAVCMQQLDWPFVGGEMRDGMASAPRSVPVAMVWLHSPGA